ncbi:MAG: hypothetical protein MUE96_03160 [Bacteroidia bacterium]|jgi:hypothetical protein|nr:hypothetical protein [Bacteroidia bacterium]
MVKNLLIILISLMVSFSNLYSQSTSKRSKPATYLTLGADLRVDKFLNVKYFPSYRLSFGLSKKHNSIAVFFMNSPFGIGIIGSGISYKMSKKFKQSNFCLSVGAETALLRGGFVYNPISKYAGAWGPLLNKNAWMNNCYFELGRFLSQKNELAMVLGLGWIHTFNPIESNFPQSLIDENENVFGSMNYFVGLSYRYRFKLK